MERLIFDNYDIFTDENRTAAIENLEANEIEPTEDDITDQLYFDSKTWWDDEKSMLSDFLDKMPGLIIGGYVGRWNGRFSGFFHAETFAEIFNKAITDCDYWKIWDENGHLFLKCSHHDGTNLFEIKVLNTRGIEQLGENENYTAVFNSNFYSRLPHFAHTVYGCKKYDRRKEAA